MALYFLPHTYTLRDLVIITYMFNPWWNDSFLSLGIMEYHILTGNVVTPFWVAHYDLFTAYDTVEMLRVVNSSRFTFYPTWIIDVSREPNAMVGLQVWYTPRDPVNYRYYALHFKTTRLTNIATGFAHEDIVLLGGFHAKI